MGYGCKVVLNQNSKYETFIFSYYKSLPFCAYDCFLQFVDLMLKDWIA